MKNLSLFLSILCLSSQVFCETNSEVPHQDDWEKNGQSFAQGFINYAVSDKQLKTLVSQAGERMDALTDSVQRDHRVQIGMPSISDETIEKTVDSLVKNTMLGARKSFQEGGQFDSFMKDFGGAGRRSMSSAASDLGGGMKDASKIVRKDMVAATGEVSKGMKESSDVWGKEVQEIFKEGSEVDKGLKQFFTTGSRNINGFINEVGHKNLAIVVGILIGGYFTLSRGIPLAFKMFERYLTRPKLIIESSKKGLITKFTSLFRRAQQPLDMVFSPALKKQLDDTIKVTTAINNRIKQGRTNVKYRNLMLYGPPGTGKTMFAKELARRSGMEYAFMSGSSFSKFKDGEGIEALDELFAWAKRSKGLMIFIDEAETFLSKRENMDPQSKAYQLLNNFLNYTGERSNQFMLVFATNHQDALDSAMYRRIDDLIEMPLPSKAQRMSALNLYKNKILMDAKQNGKEFVDSVRSCLNIATLEVIAEKTKGLSYGDLEGIINTIKTDSDIQEPAVVTAELIDTVVERAVKKHQTFTRGQPLGFVED